MQLVDDDQGRVPALQGGDLGGQRWLDTVTSAVVTGSYVDPRLSRVTIGEWAARWLEGKANLKASSRDRYAGVLATHVVPRWGAVRISDVTHADVQAWVSQVAASGLAPASVHKVHRCSRWSCRPRSRTGAYPAAGVDLPRAVTAEKRFLDGRQVASLADAARPHGRIVVLLLAYTVCDRARWPRSRCPGSTCCGAAYTSQGP